MLLQKTDLYSHLYPEVIEEIVRSTDPANDVLLKAIQAAETEAKAYLNRFDKAAMFVPTNTDELLRGKVKDMAMWHLCKLANPNVNLELARTLYEDALKFFTMVMKGEVDPDGWPLKDDPNTPLDESGHIAWSSNIKRRNHY
jgi:phage gp36-like protein